MNNLNQYKKRFYTLMESTMGDVKPLIIEQEENVVELTDLNSQVPDTLVDSEATPKGTYTVEGGRDTSDISNSFTLCYDGTCYKIPGKYVKFNYKPAGMGQPFSGKIQGTRNSFFYKPLVLGGKTYNPDYYLGGRLATEVTNNTEDKIIGFDDGGSFNFFCYVPKSGGGYVCEQFTYKLK